MYSCTMKQLMIRDTIFFNGLEEFLQVFENDTVYKMLPAGKTYRYYRLLFKRFLIKIVSNCPVKQVKKKKVRAGRKVSD